MVKFVRIFSVDLCFQLNASVFHFGTKMVLFYLVAFLQTFVTITLCVIGYFLNIKTGYKTKDKKGTTGKN